MSEDLRASNAEAEERHPVRDDSYPTLMFVEVASFNPAGEISSFRGFLPPPYGLDQEH